VKRDIGLKPRKQKDIPNEKLLEILRGIYPEEIAVELYNNLQGKGGNNA
jgi:hypothetical protein